MKRRDFFSLLAKGTIIAITAPAKFFMPAAPEPLTFVDFSAFDNVLKEIYAPVIAKLLTDDEELSDLITYETDDFPQGKEVRYPIQYHDKTEIQS